MARLRWFKVEYPQSEPIWIMLRLPEELNGWTASGECIDEVIEVWRYTNEALCRRAHDHMVMQAVIDAVRTHVDNPSDLLESLPGFVTKEAAK